MDILSDHKRLFSLILALLLGFLACTTTVFADTGPKPTVSVEFSGLPDTKCIATLLCDYEACGPWHIGRTYKDLYGRNPEEGVDEDIFQKFKDHETDGWYFIGILHMVSDTKPFSWKYYPPEHFRILIYIPETDSWLISDENSRYAFDSYFKAYIEDGSISMTVDRSASVWIKAFLLRLAITLIVEIAFALPFALRNKRTLSIIAVTNLITQILLNLLLSSEFGRGFVGGVIIYEILVAVIEGTVYSKRCTDEEHDKKFMFQYAFVANLLSFMVGLALPTLRFFPEIIFK